MRRHRQTRRAAPVLAALCAVAVGAPQAVAAGEPRPYQRADEARQVTGTSSSADAPRIEEGLTADEIAPGEQKYYALDLDAESGVHLVATVLPPPGTKAGSDDGVEVTLRNTNGDSCGKESVSVKGRTAYPFTATASRTVGDDGDEDCRAKGPYLVQVKREKSTSAGSAAWPLELSYLREPGLKGSIPAPHPGTEEETDDNNKRPAPPSGEPGKAAGGTGFNDARAVGDGVWKDRVQPGETRFYRVPVDWGQRLYARVELPNAPAREGRTSSPYVSNAYRMNLYNPARSSLYTDGFESYDGDGGKFDRYTNPVRYENRFADAASWTRFAGWYYVAVTMSPDMAKAFPKGAPVTLRIAVKGEPKDAPAYDGDAAGAGIGVSDDDREMADKGLTAAEAEDSRTMRTWGFAGIGTGTALLAALAVWMLAARRRAVPAATGTADGPWPPRPDPRDPRAPRG